RCDSAGRTPCVGCPNRLPALRSRRRLGCSPGAPEREDHCSTFFQASTGAPECSVAWWIGCGTAHDAVARRTCVPMRVLRKRPGTRIETLAYKLVEGDPSMTLN